MGAPLRVGVIRASLGDAVAGAFLGDGIVEASLGTTVAGAFLEGRILADVEEEVTVGVGETPSGHGDAGTSLGAVVSGAFLEEAADLGTFLAEEGISSGATVTPSGDGLAGDSLEGEVLGVFLGDGVFEVFVGVGAISGILSTLLGVSLGTATVGVFLEGPSPGAMEASLGKGGISCDAKMTPSGAALAGAF